jgi:hypothetical protein
MVLKLMNFIRRAYDSKSLWLALIISLLVGVFFSIIIFRDFLSQPGLLEYADIRFHADLGIQSSMFSSTWNSHFSSSNAEFMFLYPVVRLLSAFGSSYIAQRFLFVAIFMLMGTNMYVTFFAILRKRTEPSLSYTLPIIPTVAFIFNPFTIGYMGSWLLLWVYAFLPLLFYITISGMERKTLKNVIVSACTLSVTLFIAGVSQHIVFAFLFVGFLIMAEILLSLRKNVLEKLKRGLVLSGFTILLYSLLAAYWLVPWISSYRIFSSGWEMPLTLSKLQRITTNSGIFNTLTGASAYPQFLDQYQVWIFCATFIVIMAFLSIAIKSKIEIIKKKLIYSVALIAVFLIFLAKGPNPPLGNFFNWLMFDTPFRSINWLIKDPARLWSLIAFCFAFLTGVTSTKLVYLLKERKILQLNGKIIISVLSATFISCSLISGWPLLTGNASGVTSPVKIPNDYETLNSWLENQDGYFRVAWFPSSDYPAYLNVDWSPHTSDLTPQPGNWVSKIPVLTTSSPQGRVLMWRSGLIEDLLTHNKTSHIGKILSMAGVEYVVFQKNTTTPEKYEQILNGLYRQEDLKLIKTVGDLYVFKNMEEVKYVSAPNNVIFCVGGLDILPPLVEMNSYDPNTAPLIFVEQYGLPIETIEDISSTYHIVLLFYGNKNLDDLIMSTLSDNYFTTPSEVALKQPSYWEKDFMSSHLWIPYFMNFEHGYEGDRYDFDLDKGILRIWPPSEVKETNITVHIKVTETGINQIWIRTLVGPYCGNLELFLNGEKLATVNTKSTNLSGFKWQKVAEVNFNATGTHELTISSVGGFNAINLIATVPLQTFESQKERIQKIIKDSNIEVVYLIKVGDSYSFIPENEENPIFFADPSYNLPQIDYRIVEHTKFSVEVNSPHPFILVHNEAYDGHWGSKIYGENVIKSLPINFFANGYIVKPQTDVTMIEIEYLPEKYFNLGRLISLLSLSVLFGLLILTKVRKWF